MSKIPQNRPYGNQTNMNRRGVIGKMFGISSMLGVPNFLLGCRTASIAPDERDISKVQILSLQTTTPNLNVLHPRQKNETITDFAKREIEDRQLRLVQALESALTQLRHDPFRPYVTFFTVPEIYWNIPWMFLRNKDELHQLNTLYLNTIEEQVRHLIKKFPFQKWGRLIILPGTIATLIPSEIKKYRYESLNYVLVASNFNPDSKQGQPSLSMWPKRDISGLDYLGYAKQEDVFVDDGKVVYRFQLSESINVEVGSTSFFKAKQYNNEDYITKFNNQLLPSVPFGIDICADIGLRRTEELVVPQVKLDFLLAASQGLDEVSFPFPFPTFLHNSLQYIIRNDGGRNQKDALGADVSIPECEVRQVVQGKICDQIAGRLINKNV